MAKEINFKLLLKSVMVLHNTSCNNVLLEKIPCPNCTKRHESLLAERCQNHKIWETDNSFPAWGKKMAWLVSL